MAHTLPPLPYALDALEPHIDAQTMEIHHGKHHSGVRHQPERRAREAPGAAVEEHRGSHASGIASVPEDIRTAVRNNGGGHVNHSMFWQIMAPNAGGAPTGAIADAINAAFGSFDAFKEQFGEGGGRPIRQRLGVAGRQRRQARHREHAQPGQPADGRQDADARRRRVGARLLPEVPEPPARLRHGWWNVVNWAEINKRLGK